MSSSLSPITIGAMGEENDVDAGSVGTLGVLGLGSVLGRSVASCGSGGTAPKLLELAFVFFATKVLNAPRLRPDSEVEEALPTLSVSSLRDWATDGAAEVVFEWDHGRTKAG